MAADGDAEPHADQDPEGFAGGGAGLPLAGALGAGGAGGDATEEAAAVETAAEGEADQPSQPWLEEALSPEGTAAAYAAEANAAT